MKRHRLVNRISLLIFVAVVLKACQRGPSDVERLLAALDRITPGTPYAVVVTSVPKEFVDGELGLETRPLLGTYFASSMLVPAFSLYLCTPYFIFPEGPGARLYFDQATNLMGIYFAGGAFEWKPKWLAGGL